MEDVLLRVNDLSKSFWVKEGVVHSLESVSFSLLKGEALGLVGESGSGKTTLAFCLARLHVPDSGSIRFDGVDWLALKGAELQRLRRKMQVVFQDPYTSLNPYLKVGSILEEPLIVHEKGLSARQRGELVSSILDEVGLGTEALNRYPREFSGGQRQRVAIARALILNPELLIADEPLSALDPENQDRILDLIQMLKRKHSLSMMLVSHNLASVESLCDRVAVMYGGRLVEIGPTRAIFNQPGHPYTRYLLECLRPYKTGAPTFDWSSLPEGKLELHGEGHWVAGRGLEG